MNRKVYISTTHEYVKFATSIFALARYLSKTGSSLSACCSNRRTLHYKYYHNPSPVWRSNCLSGIVAMQNTHCGTFHRSISSSTAENVNLGRGNILVLTCWRHVKSHGAMLASLAHPLRTMAGFMCRNVWSSLPDFFPLFNSRVSPHRSVGLSPLLQGAPRNIAIFWRLAQQLQPRPSGWLHCDGRNVYLYDAHCRRCVKLTSLCVLTLRHTGQP